MTANEKKQLMAAACKVRMGVIKGTHAAKGRPSRREPVRRRSVHLSVLQGN